MLLKKRKKKRIEPTGKNSGSPKPRCSQKKYVFSRLTNFLFFFLLQLCRYDKTTSWNNLLPPPCPQILKKKLKNWCEQKKINETVVKFEASSVISLIPSSHVTTTPFFKKSNCRNVPPPTPPFLIFFSAFVSCSRHLI